MRRRHIPYLLSGAFGLGMAVAYSSGGAALAVIGILALIWVIDPDT